MAESNTTLRFKVAPTWKGEYILGNEYQQSDEVSFTHDNGSLAQLEDVLFGHYRSLKPNNINPLPKWSELIEDEYGRHGNDWLLILDLSDVEEATVKSIADNATFNDNESVRITHENARISNENSRISNENIRKSNETARESNEARRVNNETTRNTSENTRKQNEDIRKANEISRQGAENNRQNNESLREGNESTRISNETQRVAAEGSVQSQTGRAYAESLRVTAEQNRVNAENQRQLAEGTPDDSPSIDGSRWARYKQAEIGRTTSFNESQTARTNQYNQAEGTPEDAASATGSRWARFNYNEEQRDTKVDEKVEDITNLQEKVTTLETEKANKNGYYSELTAGAAENLVGQSINSENYLIRPTGGESNEVANGITEVVGLEGQSCVWNQLMIANPTPSYYDASIFYIGTKSFIKNHKFYISFKYTTTSNYTSTNVIVWLSKGGNTYGDHVTIGGIQSGVTNVRRAVILTSNNNVNDTVRFEYPSAYGVGSFSASQINVIDLTLMGIDNLTTVAQVEAWLAKHLGLKPHYAYNAGEILSAKTLGFKTYGQNLLNPTTRQAKLIPYEWEENSNVYTVKNVPSGATATFTPDKTGVAETVDISGGSLDITSYGSGVLELSAATADTYVCMKWDEQKDDDIVPYEEHTYNFDVRKVYGKVNGAGEYAQCFPNGMKSAKTTKDIITAASATKVIGDVDLGSLTWEYNSTYSFFRSNVVSEAKRVTNNSVVGNIISSKYITYSYDRMLSNNNACGISDEKRIGIKDSNISPSDIVSGKIAKLNGVMLNYELATPITYTNLVYRDNGVDTPLSEVLLQMQVNNWSMEEQLITPYADGNPTSIPATVNTIYSIDAVEALDTLQKTAYFADDVKVNLQALLNCINTNCSEILGGTFSISETATDKVFAFNFTPNTEPDVEPTNEGE